METAMEQRNATATLASYGQDAADFGPETDVDTPDEPVGLTKPKVEGEANIVDESGEDSEEDGGGWNYYNKSTEGIEKKIHQEDNNHTGTNSDAEDMDYKLNPDAPEFVPVSSPTATTMNQAQRFLNITDDDFISSSPQKFKESIDNVVVPDENDFTNEIKVHAGDLSKLNNEYELNDDSNILNGIHSLNDEVTGNKDTIDCFVIQKDHITNGNLDNYQNPFVSDEKVDLNKVQDLSEYINDDDQTYKTDPFVPIMETTKNNEINSTSDVNELENKSDLQINDDISEGEHIKYEKDMNIKNSDETNDSANATVGSSLQFDDDSFKHTDDYKNEYTDHIDKFGQNEDHKLNDSVSTTDAVVGSEPHTPMRMDNQSTFESENDDDQFSETFKQQIQFNQFDENNDKENHDPFCFEQTNDPEGIIPNISHEANEAIVEETHTNEDTVKPNDSSDEHQVSELTKHEPVEEPLCIKEKAKPIHSVYEQQYLPESDFSVSTHEALLNATESEFNHTENDINTEPLEQHAVVESYIEDKQASCVFVSAEPKNVDEHSEHLISEPKVPSFSDDVKLDDSNIDDTNGQNLFHDDIKCNFEQENNSVQHQSDKIELENSNVFDEHKKYVEDIKQESHAGDYIQNHVEDFEQGHAGDFIQNHVEDLEQKGHAGDYIQNHVEDFEQKDHVGDYIQNHVEDFEQKGHAGDYIQNHVEDFECDNLDIKTSQHLEDTTHEHNVVAALVQDNIGDEYQGDHISTTVHANDLEQEFHNNYTEVKPYNTEESKHDNFNVESVLNHKEDNVAVVLNQVEDIEQKYYDNVPETVENHVDNFKQEHGDNVEVKNNFTEDFIQEHHNIIEHENSHVEDFKQTHQDVVEHELNHVEDFKLEHHNIIENESNNINEDFKHEHTDIDEIVQNQNGDFHLEQQGVESIQNHTTDSDEEMHSSMIIHSDVENNTPQPYCSVSDTLVNEPDMMCTSMTFEENFQNRNMSDSLYVMETSSDYFGEEVQPTTQLEKSVDEPKVETQEQLSNIENGHVDPIKIDDDIVGEAKSQLESETKIEDSKAEITESIQTSPQDPVEKVIEQEENNKVSEIAVAAAVGTAAVAAVAGVSLASKKSAPKKLEASVSKAKTTTTKTTATKPPASKPLAPVLKKTSSSTTASKPLSRPTTAPSTSKAPTNVRPSTAPKNTNTMKVLTVSKVSPKPAPKTSLTASRPISAKTTPTTPKTTTLTKTTPISSPKTPTPKPAMAPKSATTPKTNSTPRTSTLVSKQSLTNGSPKPLNRPVSAPLPAKKSLSSATTNGTTKLTNGDVSKSSSTTKPPITLATRMSLAPPKLPPKVKTTSKTAVTQPAMPGPIRRPNKAPTTKKTETATS